MPAPTVHESRTSSDPTRAAGGALHLAVMAPNLFETHALPTGGSVSVGRDDSADVRITDELASHLHARFHIDASGTLSVEDCRAATARSCVASGSRPGSACLYSSARRSRSASPTS